MEKNYEELYLGCKNDIEVLSEKLKEKRDEMISLINEILDKMKHPDILTQGDKVAYDINGHLSYVNTFPIEDFSCNELVDLLWDVICTYQSSDKKRKAVKSIIPHDAVVYDSETTDMFNDLYRTHPTTFFRWLSLVLETGYGHKNVIFFDDEDVIYYLHMMERADGKNNEKIRAYMRMFDVVAK